MGIPFFMNLPRTTCQIGDGAAIAYQTKLPVVCEFPLVGCCCTGARCAYGSYRRPSFAQHRFCLNLGGIANISAKTNNNSRPVVGFDVCYANQILDRLAQQLGYDYDNNGELAAQGKLIPKLLLDLNGLDLANKLTLNRSITNNRETKLCLLLNNMRIAPTINCILLAFIWHSK